MTPKEAIDSIGNCCGCTGVPGTRDVIEALLRRDWAVRVLDAWAEQADGRQWRTQWKVETNYWECMVPGRVCPGAPKADAARLAAAESIWPALPADVRADLGERP